MEKEMLFWNLSFLGYMSIFGGCMHFGSPGISQHLPPLHWPAEACDQWNQGIYLASSFQSESNSKSGTVAISQKSQGTEPCKKGSIPFGTDQFWNLLFLACRCILGVSSKFRPFLHVWWKHTFGHWERNLFRCPDILRPYNMAIFPKLKHHA